MKTISTELNTCRGSMSPLVKTIRGRRCRRVALRLVPVTGSTSKYKVYASGSLVGETVIRSRQARGALTTGIKAQGVIGWDTNRNEKLMVAITF